MAVQTRPASPPPAGAPAAVSGPSAATGRTDRPGAVLLLALLAALAYAAFANGATGLPGEMRVQVAFALLAILTTGAWLWSGLRLRAPGLAWLGVGLLAAFAAWTGLSLLWSVAPDRTWTELNRGIAYVLVVVLGMAVGASMRRPIRALAIGWLLVATAVALYAFGGKAIPGVSVLGLFDFDHAANLSRLRAPLGYWNALALVCAFAVPVALRLAAERQGRVAGRLASLGALHLFLVVMGMTYSRGGVLALAVALPIALGLGAARLRSIILLGVAALASLAPLTIAFTRAGLTTDAAPLALREDAGVDLLIAHAISLAVLLVAGFVLLRLERRVTWTPARGAFVRRIGIAVAGFFAIVAIGGLVSSAGTIADRVTGFTEVEGDRITDPGRLLSTNSGNRWVWWQEAAGAWSDKPVAGWGAGSFPVTHRLYRDNQLDVLQPHSVPLQFLAETGVVGALLAIAGLLALIAAAIGTVRRLRPGAERGLAAALGAGTVAWLVHGLYDWDWDIPGITLPALLFMGVLAGRRFGVEEPDGDALPRERAAMSRGLALAGATALLCLVTVSAVLPSWADSKASGTLADLPDRATPAQLAEAARELDLAAELNPLAVEPLFAASTVAERREQIVVARNLLVEAVRRQPDNGTAWFRLARAEFVRQDFVGVARAIRRALELDPQNRVMRAFAQRAQTALAAPSASATATGTPLPTLVPAE